MNTGLRGFLIQLLMLLGVYVGVAFFVAIDVNLSLAAIDPSDPSTWPNMGPELRYFFGIPVFGTLLVVVALIVNSVVSQFHRRVFHPLVWFCFGLAYSLPSSPLALRHIYKSEFWFQFAITVAVLSVAGLRAFFGKKPSKLMPNQSFQGTRRDKAASRP